MARVQISCTGNGGTTTRCSGGVLRPFKDSCGVILYLALNDGVFGEIGSAAYRTKFVLKMKTMRTPIFGEEAHFGSFQPLAGIYSHVSHSVYDQRSLPTIPFTLFDERCDCYLPTEEVQTYYKLTISLKSYGPSSWSFSLHASTSDGSFPRYHEILCRDIASISVMVAFSILIVTFCRGRRMSRKGGSTSFGSIPGPSLSRYSSIRNLYHAWKEDLHLDVLHCHSKYGTEL